MIKFLNGYKTYIASLVTIGILWASGDKVGAATNLSAILEQVWPGILMALMRFITSKTSKV